jgi:hypothetical protein
MYHENPAPNPPAALQTVHMYQTDLLTALGEAAGLMYNTSGKTPCYEIDAAGPAAGNAGLSWVTVLPAVSS